MRPLSTLASRPFFIALLGFGLALPAQGQDAALEESFDDPNLPGWNRSPNAYPANGALRVGAAGFAGLPGSWDTFEMSVIARWRGAGQMAITFHASDAGSSILLYDGERFQLQREIAGRIETVGQPVAYPIPRAEWAALTLWVGPTELGLVIGGEPVLTAPRAESLPPGGIGFEVFGDLELELEHLRLVVATPTAGEELPQRRAEIAPSDRPGELPTPPGQPVEIPTTARPAEPPTAVPESGPGPRSWKHLGGPIGGLGYDVRHSFEDHETWYVTDAWAGIHRSTDRGLTWKPINRGITPSKGVDAVPIFSATVDPHDSDVVWIGTERTGQIYRSSDGGDTWTEMSNGIDRSLLPLSFRGFTVDPTSQNTVYAMAEIGSSGWTADGRQRTGLELDLTQGIVYKTTNGGQSWGEIWRGTSLARYCWIHPGNPDVLYVSTGIFDRESANTNVETGQAGGVGILKSTDGGRSWRELNQANGLLDLYVSSLSMHPEKPETLLAAAGQNNWSRYGGRNTSGIFMTRDGGESWNRVLARPEVLTAVEYCANRPDFVYAASRQAVYRSQDGGLTWNRYGRADGTWGPEGIIAGDAIDMQCDPDHPMRIMVNNYIGGNFLSEDGGQTWGNASQGYSGAIIDAVETAPDRPGWVYAAGRTGVFLSTDRGQTWNGLAYPGPDFPAVALNEILSLAVSPRDPKLLLAAPRDLGTLIVSDDGGNSWSLATGLPGPPISVVFSPADRRRAYAAFTGTECDPDAGSLMLALCAEAENTFHASEDGGRSWSEPGSAALPGLGFVTLIAHPEKIDTVYAGTINQGVVRTDDGGKTWQAASQGLPRERVSALAMDPSRPTTLFAGYNQVGVYRSVDGGRSWGRVDAGLIPEAHVTSLVVDPSNGRIVYLSDKSSGVYVSTNGGDSWRPLNDGLTHRTANDLALSDDGALLYVGIEGAGVYRLDSPLGVRRQRGTNDATRNPSP